MSADEYYGVAQVCRNGHATSDSVDKNPQFSQPFCDKCGAETITACPHCNTPIRGYYYSRFGVSLSAYTPPAFCYKCGKAFTWTEGALEAAKELAGTLHGLSEPERQELARSLDDLVRNTPKAQLAQTRFKTIMQKVGKDGYDGMKAILIDVVSETIKKSLFRA